MSGAREAVARLIAFGPDNWPIYLEDADEILAALRPFIAAEIRAWAAIGMARLDPGYGTRDYVNGHRDRLTAVFRDADAIASRICGTTTTIGEQQ